MDGKNVKDELIRKVADRLSIKDRIVREIVDHQFDGARDAMALHTSIEFSGFGKFFFNKKRAVTKMQRWQKCKSDIERLMTGELSQRKRVGYQMKLQKLVADMKLLKEKMERYENT